jgi:hypothetical protein
MSRKRKLLGVNAVAESFFGSLKKERVKKHIYKTRALAEAGVADYIDTSRLTSPQSRGRCQP